ncbi:coiled-coil domain-containing protein 167 [Austrofundulus limnaeus]|uniref:Coiled-coil domain-containing protein 167 n=1 Tax=Austrofundulus limnaeus TaxID=52670 RepID=A0A2I4BGZ3_AUSLI|nr:PREDICTED: coiled-coil domain-containing protein 167 [Austrofundulus limnaeus]
MSGVKDKKRENVSVATEIDRLEKRRERIQDDLEKAKFKSRKERLTEKERQELQEEMAIINERVQMLDKELQSLRGENRKNMLLSVALFAVSALLYYTFFYNEVDT